MAKILTVCLLSIVAFFSKGEDLSGDLHYFETLKSVDINRRVRRSVDPHPSSHLHEIWFTALGRNFHLYVKQTDVVSKTFKASVVNGAGEKTPLILDTSNFYTGSVKDELTSDVQLHWEGNDLHASIHTPDDIIYIEPSWRHLQKSDNHSMIVYRQTDLKWRPEEFVSDKGDGFCEMKDLRKKEGEVEDDGIKLFHMDDKGHNGHSRKKRQALPYVGTHTMCGLFVVADYRFYTNIGGGDKKVTGEYLIGMIGRVNNIYTKTRWSDELTNLGFEIQEMLIHESFEPKSTGDHYNMEDRPRDMDAVLDWFGADHRKLTGFCLGHLFTYQSFPGKLGLAYVGSWRYTDAGGICSFAAYIPNGKKVAVNTGVSTFQNPGGSRALSAGALITVSHAHNWGSEHDPDTTECAPDVTSNGKYIMYYKATTGYDPNNQVFSPCSKRFINKVVMKKGYDCFNEQSSGGRGMCGNGRIDSGEECDGGYDGDFCCDSECSLRSGAKCSSMNFACCENCNVAPKGKQCYGASADDLDCKDRSNCTGNSYTCPEPGKLSGVKCFDGGTCSDGVCLDQCEAVGQISCICTGDDSCKRCCAGVNGICAPIPGGGFHLNGRPCIDGFCNNEFCFDDENDIVRIKEASESILCKMRRNGATGACEKSDPPLVKRIFSILEYFSVDKIAIFMKNNLVWTILLFSSIIWIIAIIIIERYDRREAEEDKKVVNLMDTRGDGRRVNPRNDPEINFIGVRTMKPRLRTNRGRSSMTMDDKVASESGF